MPGVRVEGGIEVRLLKLRLRNFKGIRDFVFEPDGKDVSVWGDNAVGKTTLADAFMWLLFDKDSSNRANFDIKTLGPDGQPIHNLEHEVEGVLDLGDRQITLRKVFQEKWTKKRGSATAEFSGHTTDYFIDGVPVQQAEYKARVTQIADESTFRLLTDPRYFNEQLHWQKRREVLLQVCGDVSDREVIASDRALADLPNILGNRTLADHRKVIAARRTEINKELDKIPVRIDEATRALPEANGDRAALAAEIARLSELRQAKAGELVRIDAGGEIVERQKAVREIEIQMLDLQHRLRASGDQAVQQERGRLAEIGEQADARRREIRRLQLDGQEADREIESLQSRLQKLRAEWAAINAREFTLSVEESCPTCGQALPQEQVQAAREKALADFNARKSADLEANAAEGKRLRARLDQLLADQQQRNEGVAQAERALGGLEAQAANIHNRIDKLRSETPDFTRDAEHLRLAEAKAQIEQQIADLRSGSAATRQQVTQEVARFDEQISALRGEAVKIDQRQQGLARIDELKAQERALAAEFERLEKELYLTEEFIRAKVHMLESKINGRFNLARFRLFEAQVNGAIAEACDTMYNGVPYTTGLNTGARTVVGMDIIRTLSEHYGFKAPVWIDNRESVIRLPDMDCQVISLIVSERDKKLRVETEQKEVVA